ncbi:putative membrane protein, partial [Plasmodium gaboni]
KKKYIHEDINIIQFKQNYKDFNNINSVNIYKSELYLYSINLFDAGLYNLSFVFYFIFFYYIKIYNLNKIYDRYQYFFILYSEMYLEKYLFSNPFIFSSIFNFPHILKYPKHADEKKNINQTKKTTTTNNNNNNNMMMMMTDGNKYDTCNYNNSFFKSYDVFNKDNIIIINNKEEIGEHVDFIYSLKLFSRLINGLFILIRNNDDTNNIINNTTYNNNNNNNNYIYDLMDILFIKQNEEHDENFNHYINEEYKNNRDNILDDNGFTKYKNTDTIINFRNEINCIFNLLNKLTYLKIRNISENKINLNYFLINLVKKIWSINRHKKNVLSSGQNNKNMNTKKRNTKENNIHHVNNVSELDKDPIENKYKNKNKNKNKKYHDQNNIYDNDHIMIRFHALFDIALCDYNNNSKKKKKKMKIFYYYAALNKYKILLTHLFF